MSHLPKSLHQARYVTYALSALAALGSEYRSVFEKQEGAVLHADAHDVDVPWADYFMVEAIHRVRGDPTLTLNEA